MSAPGPVTPRQVPSGRLRLALTPGRDGRAALDIYRPLGNAGRLLRHAVALAAVVPYPRRTPDPLLAELGRLLDVRVGGCCVMASTHPERWVVGLADAGRLVAVAKVGPATDAGLRHEAAVLTGLQGSQRPRVPELLTAVEIGERYVLATAAVPTPPRADRGTLLSAALDLAGLQWTHGDLVPWNLAGDPAVLLDWENARPGLIPMYDVTHWVIRCEAALGRGDPAAVVRELCGPGGVGVSYLDRLGLHPGMARDLVRGYLDAVRQLPAAPAEVALRRSVRGCL